jgi:uncharacterized protein YybS (DUF2232 family)
MMTEGAMMVGLAAVLGYLGQMLFTPLLFIYPLPFLVLGYRQGLKTTIVAVLASLGVCSLFFMPVAALSMTMSAGFPAIIMVWAIHRHRSFSEIVIAGGLSTLVGFAGAALIFQFVSGMNVAEYVTMLTDEMRTTMEVALAGQGNLDSEQSGLMMSQFNAMIDMMKRTLPASMLITAMMISYVNMRLMIVILKRVKTSVPEAPQLKLFVLPRSVVFAVFFMYLGAMFLEYQGTFTEGVLTQNILILGMFVFLLQGWAVVAYLVETRTNNRGILVMIFVMSLLFALAQYMVMMLGMMDRFFNFRRLPRDGM